MFRDGDGLVVKRVVPSPGDGTRRLVSANPNHPDHDRRAGDIYIVGKVLWQVTRARAGAAPRRSRRQPPPGRTSSPRTFCPP